MKRVLLHIDTDPMDARALRWAHEAGLHVVGTGTSAAAVDHLYLDQFHNLESQDLPGLMSLAQAQSDATGNSQSPLAGVFSSKPELAPALAKIGQALDLPTPTPRAVSEAADPKTMEARLAQAGLRYARHADLNDDARRFQINAFFRDGDFVRGGILEPTGLESGQPRFGFQGHLDDSLEDALYDTLENAARELDLNAGPLGALLMIDQAGMGVVHLGSCFNDLLMSSYLTPLALGKSPIQAWFAALAGSGGPFDSMPHRPLRCAGWVAIRAEEGGTLGSLEGLDRARACPGIEGARASLSEGADLSHNPIVAVLWGTGEDSGHLQERLEAASERLRVVQAECSAA